ncbi:MAG: hypothetical protein EA422_07700 [Gemmatimonadales bacterium]|nr:MAG: hypothetical protein EA422_07700 [Gemmatimonadales bacterium]
MIFYRPDHGTIMNGHRSRNASSGKEPEETALTSPNLDPESDTLPDLDELPRPPLRELMERTPSRLALEAVVGAGGGAALSLALPDWGMGTAGFAVAGAMAAPIALLLTPVHGSLPYRAIRYGFGLALPVTLVISFVAGADGLLLEDLLVLGLFLFCIGAVGHGAVAAALDRFDE